MKARTTSTQPRSREGDQAGHAADFIDSIGQEADVTANFAHVRMVPEVKGAVSALQLVGRGSRAEQIDGRKEIQE